MEITILEKNIMDKIAILIPCYNEEKTIEKVVKDWKKELPDAVVYVYDNNSTDRTVELAKKAGAVVRYEYSREKAMLFEECSEKLMPNVILWLMGMIRIRLNMENIWRNLCCIRM